MSIQAKSLTLTIDNVSKIIAVTKPEIADVNTQVTSIKVTKPIILTLQYTQVFEGHIATVHSINCKEDNDYGIKITHELLTKIITKVDCKDGTTYSLNDFLGIR